MIPLLDLAQKQNEGWLSLNAMNRVSLQIPGVCRWWPPTDCTLLCKCQMVQFASPQLDRYPCAACSWHVARQSCLSHSRALADRSC